MTVEKSRPLVCLIRSTLAWAPIPPQAQPTCRLVLNKVPARQVLHVFLQSLMPNDDVFLHDGRFFPEDFQGWSVERRLF